MKIIWSEQAKKSYEKTIDNLPERWTIDIVYKSENLTNIFVLNHNKHNSENVLFIKTYPLSTESKNQTLSLLRLLIIGLNINTNNNIRCFKLKNHTSIEM